MQLVARVFERESDKIELIAKVEESFACKVTDLLVIPYLLPCWGAGVLGSFHGNCSGPSLLEFPAGVYHILRDIPMIHEIPP